MRILNTSEARKNIYTLQKEVIKNHEPIVITGKEGNAIMISEEDWNSIQETLHLISIPKMKEKILNGMNTPLDECFGMEDLAWNTKSDLQKKL